MDTRYYGNSNPQMRVEYKHVSTEAVQSMLDENSSLIVEIMNMNEAAKQGKGSSGQTEELMMNLDRKRKQLNRNLMVLAKWADNTPETVPANPAEKQQHQHPRHSPSPSPSPPQNRYAVPQDLHNNRGQWNSGVVRVVKKNEQVVQPSIPHVVGAGMNNGLNMGAQPQVPVILKQENRVHHNTIPSSIPPTAIPNGYGITQNKPVSGITNQVVGNTAAPVPSPSQYPVASVSGITSGPASSFSRPSGGSAAMGHGMTASPSFPMSSMNNVDPLPVASMAQSFPMVSTPASLPFSAGQPQFQMQPHAAISSVSGAQMIGTQLPASSMASVSQAPTSFPLNSSGVMPPSMVNNMNVNPMQQPGQWSQGMQLNTSTQNYMCGTPESL